jgi:GT2 family glycosyltransferase
MKVHIIKPYSLEKNLGKAYNEAMAMIPEGDWACLMDYDTMFLTPDCGRILSAYVRECPHAGIMTCLTNRIGNPSQRVSMLENETSIIEHIKYAEDRSSLPVIASIIDEPISGFLMMISKETWNKIKFDESGKCLGVDNDYSRRILEAGMSIIRMDALYVFHIYRMKQGVKNKTHLL